MNKKNSVKWFWKMDWCKRNNVAPADNYFWELAEEAFKKGKAK